jgi:AcrR family transcriptional regulator
MSTRNGNSSENPEKRSAILEQAIRTFADFGFRGTDVQAIADAAGVGKGTVYRYFHSKEDLFWTATFEVMLRLERHLLAAIHGIEGACNKIRAAALAYADFFQSNPNYLELFVQDRAEFLGTGPESHREHQQKMVEHFEHIIQQGIDADELRPLDTFRTTHTLGFLLYGIVVLSCHLTTQSAVQFVEHGIDIFLRGIRADPLLGRQSACRIGPPV